MEWAQLSFLDMLYMPWVAIWAFSQLWVADVISLFGIILFLEHLLLKSKCPQACRMGLWGVILNHLSGAHQYHVTSSPHTWHAWQCNYKSWQGSKERPVLCYARASAVESMKLLWKILLMTESNLNPCFACSLLCVCVSRQDWTPSIHWPGLLNCFPITKLTFVLVRYSLDIITVTVQCCWHTILTKAFVHGIVCTVNPNSDNPLSCS